jgi:hypothetical protein
VKLGLAALVIACLGLPCLAGCAREESISAYEVLKPNALARSVGATAIELPGDAQASRTGKDRLLGAIVPYAERVWFFKLVGPKDSVAAVKSDFNDVISSLRFAAPDKPEWTLPKSWKQEPGGEMRFATLRIDAPDPLEISVSSLSRGEETDAFYAIININRWRGQLGLRPIGSHHFERAVETVPWAKGTAMIVDFVGTMTAGPMSAIGASQPPAKTEKPARQTEELKYDTPAGWTAGRSGGFRKAAFDIRDGDRQAEVTVIDLGLEAGNLLSNVNRWRDQIGLDPIKADELSRTTKKISIGQREADYVEMTGPGPQSKTDLKSVPQPQSILAVALTTREKVWFIKLMGNPNLVEREKPRFEAFVKSLKLPGE